MWTAALVLLCGTSLWLRFRNIEGTLPYPLFADEGFIAQPAARILTTGTLNPHYFNYPSLPMYLTAIGMAGGFLRSVRHHDIHEIASLGNVRYPYYDTPGAVQGARQLFSVLSVVALAATGLVERTLESCVSASHDPQGEVRREIQEPDSQFVNAQPAVMHCVEHFRRELEPPAQVKLEHPVVRKQKRPRPQH
jgi:hypothetical protein